MIRVRWAPSNTGPDVHVGNVRTILYNYLFAKKMGATTVFRIEDSDLARSKPEYADAIAATLDWLGLRADEGYKIGGDFGPYTQTEKLARYKQVADELIERGLAYRCYCTQEELTVRRNALPEKQRHTFRYPGICRDREDRPNDKDYVIRLIAPTEGAVEWDDIVFGKIAVPNRENYDWVLMRSNGVPLYNFGCVVDDIDQKITHVIRGRDHIINSNIQLVLHAMLGSEAPKLAHLPMMLGPDGTKLSKRHASVSITDYRKAGYTPSGILNYLLRFGFGHGNQELFTIEDMIKKFSLEACGKNDGRFDTKKFSAIQYEHLKSDGYTSATDYAQHLLPFVKERGIDVSVEKLASLITLTRTRSKTLVEAANELDPILRQEISVDVEAAQKILTDDAKAKLMAYKDFLQGQGTWTEEAIKYQTAHWLTTVGMTIKDIGQPTRVSITGRPNSPDLFQVMAALGKDTTIARIQKQVS